MLSFYLSADSISLSGVSTGAELGMRVSGDGSIANVGIAQSSINEYSPELNLHLEGCLATEASMVVLDTLELIVQVCIVWLEQLAELRENNGVVYC